MPPPSETVIESVAVAVTFPPPGSSDVPLWIRPPVRVNGRALRERGPTEPVPELPLKTPDGLPALSVPAIVAEPVAVTVTLPPGALMVRLLRLPPLARVDSPTASTTGPPGPP